jgi:hypothetical protein
MRGDAVAAAAVDPPKMRSRADWYSASLSAKDFGCVSAANAGGGDDVEAEGRLRIRMDGCRAAGGGETVDEVITTCGIGAFLFLRI